jgi:hypothetical protein
MCQKVKPVIANNEFTLTVNLRNTVEIADLLGTLRNEILEQFSDDYKDKLPKQERGHIIHGPLPKFYIIASEQTNLTGRCDNPIECSIEDLIRSEKALLKGLLPNELQFIERPYEYTFVYRDLKTSPSEIKTIASAEWPAVISYIGEYKTYRDDYPMMLSHLYLIISRARVYSCFILHYEELMSYLKEPELNCLLDLLEQYARVIYVKQP